MGKEAGEDGGALPVGMDPGASGSRAPAPGGAVAVEGLTDHIASPDNVLPVDGMDPECLSLCVAMNKMPGIRTTESCCGHGKRPFRIWFVADSLEALPLPAYWFAGCHCGFYGWKIIAYTDCGMCPIRFMVEGPTGDDDAYWQANEIAESMAGEAP